MLDNGLQWWPCATLQMGSQYRWQCRNWQEVIETPIFIWNKDKIRSSIFQYTMHLLKVKDQVRRVLDHVT